jgi:hypothetical protein
MPNEASSAKTRELLKRGLKSDSDLMKDASTLFKFVAVASVTKNLGLAGTIALILEGSGAAAAAVSNILGRFRTDAGDIADALPAYDRFSALFYLTTVRSYLEALDEHLADLDEGIPATGPDATDTCDTKAIASAVQNVGQSSLTYLLAVDPLTDDVPLFDALTKWLATLLANQGLERYRAQILARQVEATAKSRFRAFLADGGDESTWMRRYLALAEDAKQSASLSDLTAATAAIAGWLDPASASSAYADAWDGYRRSLIELPDRSSTMYGEEFGVSKVFQTPVVTYHVAAPGGGVASPKSIEDVGRLLGALVSNRTLGRDLIVLAGGPGSGKSTLCRVFASELARSASTHPISSSSGAYAKATTFLSLSSSSYCSRGSWHDWPICCTCRTSSSFSTASTSLSLPIARDYGSFLMCFAMTSKRVHFETRR